jgi:acetyltransferase-like isoleucine patch superfamily enzyme
MVRRCADSPALRLLVAALPWRLKRIVLKSLFGYELHETAYIGLSWIYPRGKLRLGPHSRVGHGTVCRELDELELGERSTIGNWNWITGRSTLVTTKFFVGEDDRRARLRVGPHTAITRGHYLDCSNAVEIGAYTTLGGVRSVVMTHEIDVRLGRQTSRPITVGDYCYVGTGCTLLPGAVVPDRSVVAAGALVRGSLTEELRIYGGVPARVIGELPADAAYFTRERGAVE